MQEMIGKVFGRFTVLAFIGVDKYGNVKWKCICSCGIMKLVFGASLRSGNTKSCGCLMRELARKRKARLTHGRSDSFEYQVWLRMKQRCYNTNNPNYKNYGGRGIRICKRWRNSFTSFLADMGSRPSSSYSIERIDNNKGYCKDNCKWATRREQNRNKRNVILFEYKGERKCLTEWSEIRGIKYRILRERIDSNWSIEKALETSV